MTTSDTSAIMRATFARCPQCGADAGVPLVYGVPGDAMRAAAARGEVMLGGEHAAGTDGIPDRHCTRCGHRWRRDDVSRLRRPGH
jgi:hypothetical protein